MTEVNVVGVLYSVKLALHYFSKQPDTPERDRCLILGGSIAGYIDQAATIQYTAGKFALRGLLRTLRSTVWVAGVRVNLIAPWYVSSVVYTTLCTMSDQNNTYNTKIETKGTSKRN